MRAVIYLIAVLNILLGLYFVYGRPDVFRGKTLKDEASGLREGDKRPGQ